MDDFMALLASFSGRFYQLRSKRNQQRLLDAASERLGQ
jgi:putative resolvase